MLYEAAFRADAVFGSVAILDHRLPVAPTEVPRIGFLSQQCERTPTREAFRQGLRDLAYVEGTNITIEYRCSHYRQDHLLADANDLVRLKVDLIVAGGTVTALAAKKVTSTTPIVFTGGDPVAVGLVSTLARPGGNATGVSLFTYGLTPKRLALLKETLPHVGRVTVLSHSADPQSEQQLRDTKDAAVRLVCAFRFWRFESRSSSTGCSLSSLATVPKPCSSPRTQCSSTSGTGL